MWSLWRSKNSKKIGVGGSRWDYLILQMMKITSFLSKSMVEANRGFVDPRKYPYLNHAIIQYARTYNCTNNQTLILAKIVKNVLGGYLQVMISIGRRL